MWNPMNGATQPVLNEFYDIYVRFQDGHKARIIDTLFTETGWKNKNLDSLNYLTVLYFAERPPKPE